MKVFFHNDFFQVYASEPAAEGGRLEPSFKLLKGQYPFVEAVPCTEEDILLIHTENHLESIRRDKKVFPLAMLAAGAAIGAAKTAVGGEMAFALCRPPGHHASPDFAWGFCYFNNVAVAVKKLLEEGKIETALIVDFDLHFGDGTAKAFNGDARVTYWQGPSYEGKRYVRQLAQFLDGVTCDLVAVSAGFDRHQQDWGSLLATDDYGYIGSVLGKFAREKCGGRLVAVLEGGYNAASMAESLGAFLRGLEKGNVFVE